MDNHHWLMCLFFGLTWCLVVGVYWAMFTVGHDIMEEIRHVNRMVHSIKYETLSEMRQHLPQRKCGRLWLLDGKDRVCTRNQGHPDACSEVPDAV